MIELVSILKSLDSTTKTTTKQEMIADISGDTKQLLVLTYNPFITFGIKKLPEFAALPNTPELESLDAFYVLCDRLANRELTGRAARDAVIAVLSDYSEATADVLSRVLKRDLKVNLATSNINKVFHKLINVFKCMLALRINMDTFDWTNGPWLVECKYDGERSIAQVTHSSVIHFSRTGKQQAQYDGLFDAYLFQLRSILGYDFFIDGEVLADTFQDTMKSKKKGADKSKLNYQVFDILSFSDWQAMSCELSNIQRRKILESAIDQIVDVVPDPTEFEFDETTPSIINRVVLSDGRICHSRDEVDKFYLDLVSDGAEGVVIKDMNAPYVWKRNKAWLKHTPILTADLTITGRYQGKPDSKYKDVLGGFTVEGYLEDGTFVTGSLGGGFSDAQRDEFWNMNINLLIGRTVELEYREISKSENKEHPSLRFLTFKHFRDDK